MQVAQGGSALRRVLYTLIAGAAIAGAVPATALAEGHDRGHRRDNERQHRHHVRIHHRHFGRIEAPLRQDIGTVASFDGRTLAIRLNNGSTVSGAVNRDTEIRCAALDRGFLARNDDHGGSGRVVPATARAPAAVRATARAAAVIVATTAGMTAATTTTTTATTTTTCATVASSTCGPARSSTTPTCGSRRSVRSGRRSSSWSVPRGGWSTDRQRHDRWPHPGHRSLVPGRAGRGAES